MSFVSASNMEIVTEQPEFASTLIDDVDKLISFVRRCNNSIPEYIRVARMYFFGTPIRRTGSGFRRATPGCVRSFLLPPKCSRSIPRLLLNASLYATRRCIRLKLFSSRQENSDDAVIDDEIDVPLSPNGDLDFHRVKLWWGIRTCLPLEPFSWKIFHPRDRKTISGPAVHNLTNGRQNNMFLICKPSIRISSLSHTYFLPCSLTKSDGRIQARTARHMGPRAQVSAPRPRRRPRVVLQPPRLALRPRVARVTHPRHARRARNHRARARGRRALGAWAPHGLA
ncbi:hypothetical protein EDB89DRAFT_1952503 [Lactarius sanguifluus]|nr:hypothetical protein EDB89DRAFT_1952503 [Lactarius sanguifluus]